VQGSIHPGREVAVECGEGLPGARGAGDLQRSVETGEAEPLGRGPAVVVGVHPAHELAVGRGRAEPVAESVLHDLVEGARARGDVVVHDQAHHAVALDRDRPVALLLDELPEELVAQVEQSVLAVGGLAQGEQPRPGREQPHDCGRLDGMGGVLDVSSHTFNGIVEQSVETFPRYRQAHGSKPSKRRETKAG